MSEAEGSSTAACESVEGDHRHVKHVVLRWNAAARAHCSEWTRDGDVREFMIQHTPGVFDVEANETNFQDAFQSACRALAKSGGSDETRSVRAFTSINLDQIHGGSAWDGSIPCMIYREAVNRVETANNTTTEIQSTTTTTTGTSRSRGPLKPDLMIAIKVKGASHPVWVCEIRFITHTDLNKAFVWEKRHRQGLAQAIWYLFAANTLCGTSMGLLLINGKFQRLFAISSQVKVLMIEVVHGSAKHELQDDFTRYEYGKQAVPNQLPINSILSMSETQPNTPTDRLWENLVVALQIAEDRASAKQPCVGTTDVTRQELIPPSGIRLSTRVTTMEKVLADTATFTRAKKKTTIKPTSSSHGGKTSATTKTTKSARERGGGVEGRSRGGGKSDYTGHGRPSGSNRRGGGSNTKNTGRSQQVKGKGKSQDDMSDAADGDGLRKKQLETRRPAHSANPQPAAASPLTPSPEHDRVLEQHADRNNVQDWLQRQEDYNTPDWSIQSDRTNEGADENEDHDDILTSISQKSDHQPFMDMDDLARVMTHHGWKFQFISSEAMDVKIGMSCEPRRAAQKQAAVAASLDSLAHASNPLPTA